jgi:hypothetical protein
MAKCPPTKDVVLLLNAASASPLPRQEVIARLGAALQRNLGYLAYRKRRGRQTAYDAALEQELEAVASAVHYLQQQECEGSRYAE